MMAFYVWEDDVTRGLMQCADNEIYDVPIGLKGAVGEAGLVGSRGVDTFQKRIIVTAKLDLPSGFVMTKLK